MFLFVLFVNQIDLNCDQIKPVEEIKVKQILNQGSKN